MTVDFAPHVARAAAAQAQAWLAFGEVRDAVEMVKTFKKLGYAPRLFFARKAAERASCRPSARTPNYTLALVEYDRRVSADANPAFVKAYRAKWSAPPSTTGGAGVRRGEHPRRRGAPRRTLDQEKLRGVLVAWRPRRCSAPTRSIRPGRRLARSLR